jgi:predicted AlkP superfamily pyrophosphatase or phosphodiesterase
MHCCPDHHPPPDPCLQASLISAWLSPSRRRFSTFLLLLLTLCLPAAAQEAGAMRAQHVIVISIDGLRPDAIARTHAAHLQELIGQGTYCPAAQTVRPSVTVPAHVSMITGLDPKAHQVLWNRYRRGYYTGRTIFSIAKKAGLSTALFFAKKKLNYLVNPNHIDFVYGKRPPPYHPTDATAAGLAEAFARAWQAHTYALVLVHIREPDIAGHRYGWMSRPYLSAVEEADRAIGSIVSALRRSGAWDKTALIITADHGGRGLRHAPSHRENLTIPWIAVGPGVPAGLRLQRAVSVYDTAPTALAFLGLSMPGDVDGTVVTEVVQKSHRLRAP